MSDRQRRQLESLVAAVCDGTLDTAQKAQLEQMLGDSAECRLVYLQYLDMHARMTVHPNLSQGIPLDAHPTSPGAEKAPDAIAARTRDDQIVIERARAALNRSDKPARQPRPRRRLPLAGGLVLAIVAIIVVIGWGVYEQTREIRKFPVVRELTGKATLESATGKNSAQIGDRLGPGQRLRIGEDDARAVLEYADGTRIVVCFDSAVEVPADPGDAHLRLLSGTLEVDAAPQPADRPLVFATDHARYIVLGTRFRLYRETDASRLELGEGTVRLERQIDGQTVEVSAGFVAVATAGQTPLDVQPLPTAKATLLATLNKAGQVVAFSPDEKLLATGDWRRGFRTWIPGEAQPQHEYEGKIERSSGLAFCGAMVVQVGSDSKQVPVILWRPGEDRVAKLSLGGQSVRSRAISPDGRYVAESDEDGTHVFSIDPAKATSQRLVDLPGKGKAWCLALSDAAQFAGAGYWDGAVRVWRLASAGSASAADSAPLVVWENKLRHTPTQMALSADGKQLAVFSNKDGLLLVDLASGKQRLIWAAGAANVTCVRFTPDGSRLMAGLSDGTARMWSTGDGQALVLIDAGHVPRDLAWSAQDSLLVTAAGKVKLWQCDLP